MTSEATSEAWPLIVKTLKSGSLYPCLRPVLFLGTNLFPLLVPVLKSNNESEIYATGKQNIYRRIIFIARTENSENPHQHWADASGMLAQWNLTLPP